MGTEVAAGVELRAPVEGRDEEILSADALAFLAELHRRFDGTRRELLARRVERHARIDAGELPDFLPETREVRESDWRVAPVPADLQDRRVEITGPVDRKMVINALNSGARCFMADFEDANAPTWRNCLEGQANLIDANDRTIELETGEKSYRLKDDPAVLLVRPRGWHLPERHFLVDGDQIAGGLFDFGLYLFHNGRRLLDRGSGPFLYLPKLESHLEARLWNEVFDFTETELDLRPARSRRRSSSRRSSPRSRWRRSSSSCATTPPASTPAAGTTSSASSRGSGSDRSSCSPTARR